MVRGLAAHRNGFDELSFFPFLGELRDYSWNSLKKDSSAAVSVAIFSIPQAIAYSLVAGLSPLTGLVASIFGTIIAALFGSSKHLVLGPSSSTLLLIQAASSDVISRFYPFAAGASRDELALGLMGGMTLLLGLFQLLASFFKFGRLIQFVSYSVVIGYLAGSMLVIAIGQLFPLFGIHCPDILETLYQKMRYLFLHVQEVNWPTVGSAACSFFILWVLKKRGFGILAPLAMLICLTSIIFFYNRTVWAELLGQVAIIDCGNITRAFDDMHLPTLRLSTLNALLPVSFALALLGMLETNAIAKTLSSKTGQKISANQEVFALGVTNTFLSFFRALPCSGSLARSSLNIEGGAVSRFAACFSGLFVLIATLLIGGLIQYLPQVAVAVFLLTMIPKMIDKEKLELCYKATRSDKIVLLVTLASCVFLSLSVAFYIGIILSIILYLRKAATPRLAEWYYSKERKQLRPLSAADEEKTMPIRIIKVEGELFFGAIDVFHFMLRKMTEEDKELKVLILKLKHVHDLDVNFAIAIKQMYDFAKSCKKHLLIDSIPAHVAELLERTGVADYIGSDNLFLYNSDHSFEKTYERAQALIED
jgi:SulP family sulfate permease